MVGIHYLTQNNQASNKANLSELTLTKGAEKGGKVESEQGQTKDKHTKIFTNKDLQMFGFEIYQH